MFMMPHTTAQRAAHVLPKKSLLTLSNSTYHTPLVPQPMVASPNAPIVKPVVALPFDFKKALTPAPYVKGVMKKPHTPFLPALTLGKSVKSVDVKGPLKIKKGSLIPHNLEANGRMAVFAYEGRAQKEEVDLKHAESEIGSGFLPANDEFTQDHENNSVAERAMQKTKCSLCGEMVPAGPQFLQLHEELYHFQEVIELE